MDSHKKIYIILVNYNGWKDTIECLESILHSSSPSYRIIVCNNGSFDGSLSFIKEWAEGKKNPDINDTNPLKHLSSPPNTKPINYSFYSYDSLLCEVNSQQLSDEKLIIIDIGSNLGFAGGNNAGVRFAQIKNDYSAIWFLNNDTVIEKDTLKELVDYTYKCHDSGKKIGIIGSKLLYYDRPDTIQAAGGIYYRTLAYSRHIGTGKIDYGQFDNDNLKMDYIVGASMLVTKEYIEDVGLMNEEYFIYFEETDWITRGKKKGWETGYAWRSRVYHKEGASIGANKQKRTKSSKAVYYYFRSALIFTKRYYPIFTITVTLRIVTTLFIRFITGEMSKVKAMFQAVTGKDYID